MELVYQPSEQFDLLQGLGFGPKLAEAIDKLCQESFLPLSFFALIPRDSVKIMALYGRIAINNFPNTTQK